MKKLNFRQGFRYSMLEEVIYTEWHMMIYEFIILYEILILNMSKIKSEARYGQRPFQLDPRNHFDVILATVIRGFNFQAVG